MMIPLDPLYLVIVLPDHSYVLGTLMTVASVLSSAEFVPFSKTLIETTTEAS